jgi:hypothetical protein
MDATHKTNIWNYKLTTLLVKTPYGNYLPAAQFFVSEEENKIVQHGLEVVRSMCACAGFTWEPRYFITDSSNIETLAIK